MVRYLSHGLNNTFIGYLTKGLLVYYFSHDLNNRPFNDRAIGQELNTGQVCYSGVDFSIVTLNYIAIPPTFLQLFVAQKFGDLKVGQMVKFDRAISMTFAQGKSYDKSAADLHCS